MIDNQTFLIGKTLLIGENTIRINSFINRGASCATYECTLYNNNTVGRKMLLKEFLPSYAGFPNGIIIHSDSVNCANNKIIGRYLPALSENFESAYQDYLDTIKNIDALIENIQCTDSRFKRYLVPLPDTHYRKFDIDMENHTYNAFMLFDYESSDIERNIDNYSFSQRLTIVETLCQVVAKFHNLDLLFCDLKPSNFLYDFDGATAILKIFDFDSIISLKSSPFSEYDFVGTGFYSAPEIIGSKKTRISTLSDIYSLAAILLYFVMYEQIKNDDLELYTPSCFLENFYLDQLIQNHNCTEGFCHRFIQMIRKYANSAPNKRYDKSNKKQPALQLADDIHTLIEIYENKGVHPEVMLDHARGLTKNNTPKFDEALFTEVTEVEK